MFSPVRQGVVTAPAVVNEVDVAESLVQLLPGVSVAGQTSHLALLVEEVVGVEVREVVVMEVGVGRWRESPSVQAAVGPL